MRCARAFLKAAHIAEKNGFKIIHGIVDSLWIKKEDASPQNYIDLCKEISGKIGVSLNFEGRYKWIVFLPSRIHPNVAVLNRYYGVKEDGKIKVRGIEARRRGAPKFVYDAQMEMIKTLAIANNVKEFYAKIPDALNIVRKYRKRLIEGEIPIWDLIITKRLSKPLDSYKQKVSQVIAAEQLLKEGVKVPAGKNVRFLFTSADNKHYERRVRAEELIEENIYSDVKKYLSLLYIAALNLLSPFSYSAKDVYDSVRGLQCAKLVQF